MPNANWGTCVQPLLHAIVFLVEIALAARLTVKFNAYYEEQPGSSDHHPSRDLSDTPLLPTPHRRPLTISSY